jgi:hypothetical protein
MTRPQAQFILETTTFTKVKYLQEVLERLQNEVGIPLNAIVAHNNSHDRKVGFWAGFRLLMPVVETVARVAEVEPWSFLRNHLDVKAASLSWQIFRHSLIHGDLLRSVKYNSKEVGWGALIGSPVGHIITSDQIGLDIIHLYNKLVQYLENEIAKNDNSTVEIETSINYTNPEQYIIDDFYELENL